MNAKITMTVLGAMAVSLFACGSSGDDSDAVYLAGDGTGQSHQQYFFEDYAESRAIYVIVPVSDGKTEDPIKVSIRVQSLYGVDMENLVPDPIWVATVKPVDGVNPHRVAIRFPDPAWLIKRKSDDPSFAEVVEPPRAIGKFTAVVEQDGNTRTATFEVLRQTTPPPADNSYYDYDLTPSNDSPPPSGQCTSETVHTCPLSTVQYTTKCCTTTSRSCGTSFVGTGLCY